MKNFQNAISKARSMGICLVTLSVLSVMMSGCLFEHMFDPKLMELDKIKLDYVQSVRWNKIGAAARFLERDNEARRAFYKLDSSVGSIVFTDYEIQSEDYNRKKKISDIIVRYTYHDKYTLREEVAYENQHWFIDEDHDDWRVRSDLPQAIAEHRSTPPEPKDVDELEE